MTLTEFREMLEAWWIETDRREMTQKNSQGALMAIMEFYKALGSCDRDLADQVIAGWVSSANARKRFDALAMVDQFRIRAAIAPLRREEAALTGRRDNEAPYELAKVKRILLRLETESGASP